MSKELEEIFSQKIKFIGDDEHTYIGYPDKLITEVEAYISKHYIKKEGLVNSKGWTVHKKIPYNAQNQSNPTYKRGYKAGYAAGKKLNLGDK